MRKRIAAIILLLGAFASVAWAQVGVPVVPFIISTCNAAAICCQVAVPQFTQPVPGGTPTVVNGPAPLLYGMHVSNTTGSTVYAQLFNSAATPAAAATPIGASSWAVSTISDKDVSIGELQGIAFNGGITACCSTTQGTFTAAAAGACGFILETR